MGSPSPPHVDAHGSSVCLCVCVCVHMFIMGAMVHASVKHREDTKAHAWRRARALSGPRVCMCVSSRPPRVFALASRTYMFGAAAYHTWSCRRYVGELRTQITASDSRRSAPICYPDLARHDMSKRGISAIVAQQHRCALLCCVLIADAVRTQH